MSTKSEAYHNGGDDEIPVEISRAIRLTTSHDRDVSVSPEEFCDSCGEARNFEDYCRGCKIKQILEDDDNPLIQGILEHTEKDLDYDKNAGEIPEHVLGDMKVEGWA